MGDNRGFRNLHTYIYIHGALICNAPFHEDHSAMKKKKKKKKKLKYPKVHENLHKLKRKTKIKNDQTEACEELFGEEVVFKSSLKHLQSTGTTDGLW